VQLRPANRPCGAIAQQAVTSVRRLSYRACRRRVSDGAPLAHRFSTTLSPNRGDNVKRAVLGSLTLSLHHRRRGALRRGGHSS